MQEIQDRLDRIGKVCGEAGYQSHRNGDSIINSSGSGDGTVYQLIRCQGRGVVFVTTVPETGTVLDSDSAAAAILEVNDHLLFGSYDYDAVSRTVTYRTTVFCGTASQISGSEIGFHVNMGFRMAGEFLREVLKTHAMGGSPMYPSAEGRKAGIMSEGVCGTLKSVSPALLYLNGIGFADSGAGTGFRGLSD